MSASVGVWTRPKEKTPSWPARRARTVCARVALMPTSQSARCRACAESRDRKSTRLNSSHSQISYAVFCLKKKKRIIYQHLNLTIYNLLKQNQCLFVDLHAALLLALHK